MGFARLNSWSAIFTSTSEIHMVLHKQVKLRKEHKHFERHHPIIPTNVCLLKDALKHLSSSFFFLSPLASMTQLRNVRYTKAENTFIVWWNSFRRTHAKYTRMYAYLVMGRGEMGIKGNKYKKGAS